LAAPASASLGILGGTFDPVHNAHLAIARLALDALQLARVLWVPTGAPGYRIAPVAPGEDRVAMLERAIDGEPRYAVDARELSPKHSGYTVDTLATLRAELGDQVPLVLLMGGDQFAKLDSWQRWQRLFELAHLAIFERSGWEPKASPAVRAELAARRAPPAGDWRNRPAGTVLCVEMAPLEVSATAIRRAIARGEDVSRLLPRSVLDYIGARGLYRN